MALVLYGKWFKKLNLNILINILINLLFGGHPGRVFDPDLDLGQPECLHVDGRYHGMLLV